MYNINTSGLSLLILLATSYSVLSSTYFCGHAQGGQATRCYRTHKKCEEECTSFEWCIAYSYGGPDDCSLMTSTGSCSNGWSVIQGKTATKISDLIPLLGVAYNCMVKGIAQNLT